MGSLDWWRANESLNLVQAAILTVGADPQEVGDVFNGDIPEGFDAIFTALLQAVNDSITLGESPHVEDWAPAPGRCLSFSGNIPKRGFWEWRDGYSCSVSVDNLRAWLKAKGVKSEFFFPCEITPPTSSSNYSTALIAIQNAAIAEFFEPRRNVDAKKEEVVAWIKSKMLAVEHARFRQHSASYIYHHQARQPRST